MMRLCFVGTLSSVHLQRWIRFFADTGYDVDVVTTHEPLTFAHPTVRVHVVPGVRLGRPAFTVLANTLLAAPRIFRLRTLFRQIRPDVVHAHYLNEGALFALLTGVHPFVATAWGSDVLIAPQASTAARLGLRLIARRADLLTCDARHVRDALVRLGADPARVHLTYFGTDVERFHPRRRDPALHDRFAPPGAPVVISLRRLAPIYDIGTLVAAVPLVLRDVPEAAFVLAGGGPEEAALRSLARTLGVSERVHFVGELAEEDLPAYLASSDIYVSTALSDGGLAASTAEAMACAVPVIITDVADNGDWIRAGDTGYLIPPRDVRALAAQILYLATHPEVRASVGARGRRVIEERNNWRVEMGRVGALYDGLLRTPRPRA